MFRFLLVALLVALTSAFMAPVLPSKVSASKVTMQHGGKGFGGGEATRDPEPTAYDPNDPKGKQQAIHKAESFSEYLAKRSVSGGVNPASGPAAAPPAAPPAAAPPAASAPAHGGKGFGGGEATRDPEPTAYDPNDPKGKQQAIHKAESFAEYLAKRGA